MTTFPNTREALTATGYEFQRRTRCKGCGATIEFWLTPTGKWLPMNYANGTMEMQPHWQSCPKANDFRREKEVKQEVKVEVRTELPKQKELF